MGEWAGRRSGGGSSSSMRLHLWRARLSSETRQRAELPPGCPWVQMPTSGALWGPSWSAAAAACAAAMWLPLTLTQLLLD